MKKKTYKPLIAWLIGFTFMSIVPTKMLPDDLSIKTTVSVILGALVLSIYILMLIIDQGEYVYWINGGPTYEEAKKAGSEKRKEFTKAHLDIFFKMMIGSFVYLIFSFLLKIPMWIDILVVGLIVVISTFKTVGIKFNK